MDLPSLKNDITNNLELQKPVIYSRYQNADNASHQRRATAKRSGAG
jgi:hypothetical protein